ncbi:hypothetical protein GCM10029976_010210 [Kribbella albertanoniae]|uniref:Uncharacterized protein n=1 Tax=Kribbella albertanoniae TaxID=1266829 RepID=A0A4R4P7H9_9ACTN|nr:hypothetical protein [Kribbella albertanoniae]TDC16122.1 hypothetical protein E1261_39535 [Kribbella albertanoniae]
MPKQDLNPKERSVLLTLLAEGREMSNADLQEVAGLKLDGTSRLRLNDLKLVDSEKRGRLFVHSLTEQGAAWCEDELSVERPARAGAFGGALYAILGSLQRYVRRSGLHLAEVFQAPSGPDLPQRVRDSYQRLSKRPGESWISLAALREDLADVPRNELDEVLEEMSLTAGVHVQAEANQQSLTEADHDAAVRFGGSSRHILKIERP